ncbi:hypothetical protein HMPREF2531_02341 [Bacteroides intestinalis]|uniref:Uncharacterized protein n=1 Tax=Bacteroides intestinalis TaxID=329854 RepID=A0A139LFM0_9BACE|nr:hypothetical protein HMPREF2531_02341 [Bacteroides intestinalis]
MKFICFYVSLIKKARLSSFYHLLDYSCHTFLLSLGLKIGLF